MITVDSRKKKLPPPVIRLPMCMQVTLATLSNKNLSTYSIYGLNIKMGTWFGIYGIDIFFIFTAGCPYLCNKTLYFNNNFFNYKWRYLLRISNRNGFGKKQRRQTPTISETASNIKILHSQQSGQISHIFLTD